MKYNRGFADLFLLILVISIAISGGVYYLAKPSSLDPQATTIVSSSSKIASTSTLSNVSSRKFDSQNTSVGKDEDYISGTSGEILTKSTILGSGETYTTPDGSLLLSLSGISLLTVKTAATTTTINTGEATTSEFEVPSVRGNLYIVICSGGTGKAHPNGLIQFIIRKPNQRADCQGVG